MRRRRRALVPAVGREAVSTSWRGHAVPDPARPADYGAGASYRRADRYVGGGQPRQYPDPQRLHSPSRARLATAAGPLTGASPAGGHPVTTWDFRAPDRVGSAQARSIQAMYGMGQAGELGEVRWGMPGMPRDAVYRGELGRLQAMHGAQLVAQDARRVGVPGNRSGVRAGMGTGIPSQAGLPSLPLSPAAAVLAEMGGW